MGVRSVACPTCGRAWTGHELRYCGACGARLPVPDRAAPARRALRTVGGVITGIAVLATVVVLAASIRSGLSGAPPSDPRVELPDAATEPAEPPLSEEEAEELLQRVDPLRLRCEPRGCELWRLERTTPSAIATVADLVVVLEHQRLIALDVDTGEQRWTAPVGRLRSYSSETGEVRATSRLAQLHPSPNGDGVLLVTSSEVSLVGLNGQRVWSRMPEPGIAWAWATAPDTLVQHGAPGRRRPSVLRGRDATTGAVRWEAEAATVHLVEPDVIVVGLPQQLRIRGLDPVTGATLWERPTQGRRAQSFGPWVAQHRVGGVTLLERTTGELAGSLSGYITRPSPVQVDGLWLGVVTADLEGWQVEHPTPLMVVALTEDAEVAWRLSLTSEQAVGCCSLLLSEDERTVSVHGALATLEVDVATGELLSTAPPGRPAVDGGGAAAADDDPAAPSDADDGQPTDDDVGGAGSDAGMTGPFDVRRSGDTTAWWDGLGDVVIEVGGEQVEVHGREVWIESFDPLVVGSPEHLMGIRPVHDR